MSGAKSSLERFIHSEVAGSVVMSWIAVKSGRGALPEGVTWMHVVAAAGLIGFALLKVALARSSAPSNDRVGQTV